MRFLSGRTEAGAPYAVSDPLAGRLRASSNRAGTIRAGWWTTLFAIADIFAPEIATHAAFRPASRTTCAPSARVECAASLTSCPRSRFQLTLEVNMLQTWRWFGPDDVVTLDNVKQAGATGVVSALHHLNTGGAWPEAEVPKRRKQIEDAGLIWSVVESIGVGEEIKTRTGDFQAKIDNYKQSIRTVARAGREGDLLQLHGDHRLDAHQSRMEAAYRRLRAALRRRRFRRLRPVRAEAQGRRGRLSGRAHRRGREALQGDDASADRCAGKDPDRLAARTRFRLRPRRLPQDARSLQGYFDGGDARAPVRLPARDHAGGGRGGRAAVHPPR